jgi:hypothetical protein
VCFISSNLCHTNHWTISLQIRERWFIFVAPRSFVSWYSCPVTQKQQWKILLTSAVPLQKCIMVPLWCPCVPCLSICSPTHPIVSLSYTSKEWIWVSWTTPSTQSKVCLSRWGSGDRRGTRPHQTDGLTSVMKWNCESSIIINIMQDVQFWFLKLPLVHVQDCKW